MLPFNTEFQTGQSRITQVRLSVLLRSGTLLNMTEENVMLGGFIRDTSTTVDGEFTIGGAVTGKLTVVVDNSMDTFSGYDFRGAVITASLGGQLSDESYQLLPVGIYTVDEYTYDGCNITLTAYDNLFKFDIPCKDSSITFPKTITQLLEEACYATRTLYPNSYVELANISIPNGSYSVTKKPKQWDTMTWHDVVSYCAQIAGCFARILPNGKLFLSWYSTEFFNGLQIDGGTFGTQTTPYSDGAIADGGDFTYTDTTVYDGGTFGDRSTSHFLSQLFDLTVDTDDALITGVSVILSSMDNINATDDTPDYTKTLGTAEYVIRIENNPLIETTANADAVCSYIYNIIVGMRFRPLRASILENPSVEAGDVALVIDRNNNTYYSFLSHVTYTTGATTSVSCDAASTMQNLKARYSEAEKTRALAQRTFDKSITSAEQAMSTILTAIATTMGLYQYEDYDSEGGTIYIYGNKNTLASSDIRWKFSAGAVMVSSDYGATWNGAFTADGQAVLQEIYAVKVNADNIQAGTLSFDRCSGGTATLGGSNDGNGKLEVKNSSGTLVSVFNNSGIKVGECARSTLGNATGTRINTVGEVRNVYDNRYTSVFNGGVHFGIYSSSQSSSELASIYALGADYNALYLQAYGMDVVCLSNRLLLNNLVIAHDSIKSKCIESKNFGDRLLYCYETPTPYFGDIGTGKTDENGEAIIDIDSIFDEGINTNVEYSVFLQKEGQGDIWIDDKQMDYFIVKGTPNLKFSWELKAVQKNFETYRMDDMDLNPQSVVPTDENVGMSMEYDLEQLDNEIFFEEVV